MADMLVAPSHLTFVVRQVQDCLFRRRPANSQCVSVVLDHAFPGIGQFIICIIIVSMSIDDRH